MLTKDSAMVPSGRVLTATHIIQLVLWEPDGRFRSANPIHNEDVPSLPFGGLMVRILRREG